MDYITLTNSISDWLDVTDVQTAPTTLYFDLANGRWNMLTAQFLALQITGSQVRNPFGFNSRRDALIESVKLKGPSSLAVTMRRDTCFEPYDDEQILVTTAPSMINPTNGTTLTTSFWILSIDDSGRATAGLVLSIAIVISAFVSMLQGAPGAGLSAVWCLQTVVLISSNACTRFRIAAYMRWSFWVVKSTLRSTAFVDANDEFGVAFTHMLIGALPTLALYLAAKRFRFLRRLWPAVPQMILGLLFQGTTHAGWFLIVSSDYGVGYRIVTFLLMVVSLVFVAIFLRASTNFHGLKFLQFPAGPLRRIFRGAWAPAFLRRKYAPVLELWGPEAAQHAFGTYFAVHLLSALLMAIEPATFTGCLALHSVALTVHSSFFMLLLFVRPARSLPHNIMILVQQFTLTAVLAGTVLALDCSAEFPRNAQTGEALLVICLSTTLVCSIAANIIAVTEMRLLRTAEAEEAAVAETELQTLYRGTRGDVGGGTLAVTSAASDSGMGVSIEKDRLLSDTPVRSLKHYQVRDHVKEDEWFNRQVLDEAETTQPQGPRSASGALGPQQSQQEWVTLPPKRIAPASSKADAAREAEERERLEALRRGGVEGFLVTNPAYRGPPLLNVLTPSQASPRRALLGSLDRSACCPRCQRFLGDRRICTSCATKAAAGVGRSATRDDGSPGDPALQVPIREGGLAAASFDPLAADSVDTAGELPFRASASMRSFTGRGLRTPPLARPPGDRDVGTSTLPPPTLSELQTRRRFGDFNSGTANRAGSPSSAPRGGSLRVDPSTDAIDSPNGTAVRPASSPRANAIGNPATRYVLQRPSPKRVASLAEIRASPRSLAYPRQQSLPTAQVHTTDEPSSAEQGGPLDHRQSRTLSRGSSPRSNNFSPAPTSPRSNPVAARYGSRASPRITGSESLSPIRTSHARESPGPTWGVDEDDQSL
jgi:hypothetical protein